MLDWKQESNRIEKILNEEGVSKCKYCVRKDSCLTKEPCGFFLLDNFIWDEMMTKRLENKSW